MEFSTRMFENACDGLSSTALMVSYTAETIEV